MMQSRRIQLCSFEQKHKEPTRQWANDPELMKLLDRANPVSEREHEQWFANLHADSKACYFAIETLETKRHIGNAWLYDLDWRHRKAEVRIIIGERDLHSKGLGAEVIETLCGHARETLNLHKLYAYVLSINPRARRSFEKAGFTLEGTLVEDRWSTDHYVDVFLLGKLLA